MPPTRTEASKDCAATKEVSSESHDGGQLREARIPTHVLNRLFDSPRLVEYLKDPFFVRTIEAIENGTNREEVLIQMKKNPTQLAFFDEMLVAIGAARRDEVTGAVEYLGLNSQGM